jgi:hypothetical protein
MNKFLLILFIFSSVPALSQEENTPVELIQGSKELPLELNLLVQTLQESSFSKEDIKNTILKIDSYARLLTKEDIFLVGKIEIYKTLLKSKEFNSKATINGDSLATIKAALKTARDPFIKWFLQALLHDCDYMISSSTYKDYILQKNNGRLEKLEYKKMDKKVQLLYRWVSKLTPDSSDFESVLKAELSPFLFEALKNIEQSYFLMAFTLTGSKLAMISDPKDLKLFNIRKPKPSIKLKKEKSVDEILAPITNLNPQSPTSLPEPSNENWLNDDNAPANLKNLPKPSDDADWLQDI